MVSKILVVLIALALIYPGCVQKRTTFIPSEEPTTQPDRAPTPAAGKNDLSEMTGTQPTNPDYGLPDDVATPAGEILEGDASVEPVNNTKAHRTITTGQGNLPDLSEMTGSGPANPDYGEDDVTESTGEFAS